MKRFYLLMMLLAVVFMAGDIKAAEECRSEQLKDNAALWYWMAFSSIPDNSEEYSRFKREWKTMPIEEYPQWLIEDKNYVFRHLHRGAEFEHCVWGADFTRDGIEAMLNHLGSSRDLARLALARARYFFEHDLVDDAMEEVSAAMILSRHSGTDGSIIGVLVQISIEMMVQDFIVDHLYRLDRDQLIVFKEKIASLPTRNTMWSAVESERQTLDWWVSKAQELGMESVFELIGEFVGKQSTTVEDIKARGGDTVEGFVSMVEQCRPWYDKLEKMMKVAPSEIKTESKKFKKLVEGSDNPLVREFLSTVGAVRLIEIEYQMSATILDAMIEYQLGGMAAFNKVVDPYDGQPFDMFETDEGLVVRSRMVDRRDKFIEMTFVQE